jgi:hypothetical protein
MVTKAGQIFLIDFGIARFFKEGQTQDTVLLGSPGYAPPEQHGMAQTNPRSDIYGLGATLHYCLTGRDPYYAEDHFTFASVRQVNPQVPAALDQLIQRMVAQDENIRPNSALEVQQALQKIGQHASEQTSPSNPRMAPMTAIPPTTPPFPPQNPVTPSAMKPETPNVPPSIGTAATQYVVKSVTPDMSAPPQAPTVAITPVTPIPAAPTRRNAPRKASPTMQGIPQLTPTSTPAKRIWTGGFLGLWTFILGAGTAISFATFNYICPSAHITVAFFALTLAIMTLSCTIALKSGIPRVLMGTTALISIASCYAPIMQAVPELLNNSGFVGFNQQCNITPAIAQTFADYDLLLTLGLVAIGLISLYWLSRSTDTATRNTLLILNVVALAGGIGQYFLNDLDPSGIKYIVLLIVIIVFLLLLTLVTRIERTKIA